MQSCLNALYVNICLLCLTAGGIFTAYNSTQSVLQNIVQHIVITPYSAFTNGIQSNALASHSCTVAELVLKGPQTHGGLFALSLEDLKIEMPQGVIARLKLNLKTKLALKGLEV
ncbi:hypothetical protein FNB79_00990 [Formosa sediminum]|uniref:Uncharacterized protein n=1 Tax=Formosa sediminum TaxID=2594004 RepID=A0A516GM63_9FLAO|nr:hypothetical protein [Formosa sediminum]QDO92614.1 hypothetical protein FNB79_00990 [Formosa sediminum]